MAKDLSIDQSGAVRTIRIARPQSRNGLTPQVCEEIAAAIDEAGADPEVRALVLASDQGHFCSGADLMAAMQVLGERSHESIVRDSFHALIRSVTHVELPVLASIRGGCVGFGFDLALACDLRIASEQSKLGAVFTRLGLVPDGGSSFTLSRLVGLGRAMEIVLLAETFDGRRAAELGIVNRVYPDDELDAATDELAARLAAGPPLAYRHAKRNFREGTSGTLEEALEREVKAQVECLASQDVMEGVQAFFQKRKPVFRGE